MSAASWDAFWVGGDTRRLYAALHPSSAHASTGVVCVPPLLHEQARSRRFITEVAGELATHGLPCMRFDFHGTGDSDGAGGAVDFAAMARDLDAVVADFRARTGVECVAVLAWRGAALAVSQWIAAGGRADRVLLWEPVTDGAQWLEELVRLDAAERQRRPRPRPGVPRTSSAADGQLMGFAASQQFRSDLSEARLPTVHQPRCPTWLIARDDFPANTTAASKVIVLPASAPAFGGSAQMESALFLSPPVRAVVAGLARSLTEAVPA